MKNAIFVLTLFLSLNSFSQLDFGFIGKKNLFNLSVLSAVNTSYAVNNSFHYYYYDENGRLQEKSSIFRVSFRFKYARLLRPRISLGIEVGYTPNRGGTLYYLDYTPFFHTISVAPLLQFHNKNSLGFNGFRYYFGAGPSISYPKVPKVIYNSSGKNVTDKLWKTYKPIFGMDIFLGISKSFALNNNFYLNCGVRMGFHFVLNLNKTSKDIASINSVITQRDLKASLNERILTSIFDFKLGFSYQF